MRCAGELQGGVQLTSGTSGKQARADLAPPLSQELLTRHKPMVADFLDKNYDEVS